MTYDITVVTYDISDVTCDISNVTYDITDLSQHSSGQEHRFGSGACASVYQRRSSGFRESGRSDYRK